jgi:hypothetical protein
VAASPAAAEFGSDGGDDLNAGLAQQRVGPGVDGAAILKAAYAL